MPEHPTTTTSPAYLLVSVKTTGSIAELAQYRDSVEATVKPFGGRYLVRTNDPEVLEGNWADDQIVVVEFPSIDAARAWNSSPQYQAIAHLRIDNTNSTRVLVTGLA